MKDFLGMIDPLPLRLGGIVRSDPGEIPLRNPIEDFEKRDWGRREIPKLEAPVPQFKAGDRVRATAAVNEAGWLASVGDLGTISEDGCVVFDDRPGWKFVWHKDWLELIPSGQPEADGWIEWKGGAQPVPAYSRVEVQFRDTSSRKTWAETLRWWHVKSESIPYKPKWDIVAYRVLP